MHQSYFSARTTYLFEWWAMKTNDNNWNLWYNFCCLTVNKSIYTKTAVQNLSSVKIMHNSTPKPAVRLVNENGVSLVFRSRWCPRPAFSTNWHFSQKHHLPNFDQQPQCYHFIEFDISSLMPYAWQYTWSMFVL